MLYQVNLVAEVNGSSDDANAQFDLVGWAVDDVERVHGEPSRIKVTARTVVTLEASSEEEAKKTAIDFVSNVDLGAWEVTSRKIELDSERGIDEILDVDIEMTHAAPEAASYYPAMGM